MSIKILVPVALVAIGAGLYGVSQQYLNSPNDVSEPTPQNVELNLVNVLVLNESVERGQLLSNDLFSIKQISENRFAASPDKTSPRFLPNWCCCKKGYISRHLVATRHVRYA